MQEELKNKDIRRERRAERRHARRMTEAGVQETMYRLALILPPLAAIGFYLYLRYFYLFSGFMSSECIFLKNTGFYCPGCGGTRSFNSLIHGRFAEAFLFHPALIYAFVWWLIFVGTNTVEKVFHTRRKIGLRFRMWQVWSGIGILLLQWIVKNILWHGFGIRVL